TIIVNCNPETVSTDYDTSDKLYFEPLTLEDVLSIYREEKPAGVIAQFGGQTPLNLASELERNGVKILGTSPEIIDLAEDRGRFKSVMDSLNIPMPESGMAATLDEAREVVARIGYPVMVRPSYVLGGRGMEIVYDEESLANYVKAAKGVTPDRPILIDRFLNHALECEADAICDGTHAYVPAVMEHIELAGIHSGDSACFLPSRHISPEALSTIKEYTRKIAEAMHVVGLMNIQYAIEAGKVFVLEANPRASRTVPLVSKVCGIRMVPLAVEAITRELTGKSSPLETLGERVIPYYGVKESVFPFNMYQEVDPVLGPEMRSTGEVLGLASIPGEAFFKAEEAAGGKLPLSGTVLFAVSDSDKRDIIPIAQKFSYAGFKILATEGTYEALKNSGVDCECVGHGRPDTLDHVINGHVQMIINTPREKALTKSGSLLRRGAVKMGIPYVTTIAAADAAIEGIMTVKAKGTNTQSLKSIKEWHNMIH
ncbi:MAG: ATP-grasp domain-containing protein, partial [Synergistaceae bacterium]|nr:ATP-grasp domain-containing protein [Synergistaceae bacterium]